MIRPQIEAMYGQSSHSGIRSIQKTKDSVIFECTNITVLHEILESNRAVAIMFTNKMDSKDPQSKFESIVREKSNHEHLKLIGVIIESSVSRDICQEFQVIATPTFMFYANNRKLTELSSSDANKLQNEIDSLINNAILDVHQHEKLSFTKHLELLNGAPAFFNVSSNHELIFKKLYSLLNAERLEKEQIILDKIKAILISGDYKTHHIPSDYLQCLLRILNSLDTDNTFPVLDIIRQMSLNPKFRTENMEVILENCIRKTAEKASNTPTKLMMLKLV